MTVTINDGARTAVITGSAAPEGISVASEVPQANDPSWQVDIHPLGGNDTIFGGNARETIYASAGDDVSDGGGEQEDRLMFDLSGLGLAGDLTFLDSSHSVAINQSGTLVPLFAITVNANGSITVNGLTANMQAAFGLETTTNIERFEFSLGGGNAVTVIEGTPASDWLPGTAGNDFIYGYGGDDPLWGGEGGTNYLFGGPGRDLMVGGPGIDHIKGGGGVDTASYQKSSGPVTASLADPSINTGDAAGDTYENIWQLNGSPFGSTLYGDNTGQQNELLATGGTNFLHGGIGYATFVSGSGDDHMFGGAGGGLADYEIAAGGLTASLADPSINTGEAAGDTYSNVHDLAGSFYNDILYGDGFGNNMIGLAGDDFMSAGAGNDTLTGGPGANTLIGGPASDFFIFNAVESILSLDPLAVLADARAGIYSRIVDFNQGTPPVPEGDSLHIEGLLHGLYNGGNTSTDQLIRVIQDVSNAFARFQVHAADGTWLTIARLDGLHVGDIVGVVTSDTSGVTNLLVQQTVPPVDVGTHGVSWPISGVGDFNADGHTDILWRSPSTGQVDQWQMRNGGWSQSIDLGATKAANWTLAGTGDFDGDGTSDVLWRDISNSQVDQWHMKNGNWAGSIDLGATKGADWTLAGVADFNGDGTSDVLWRKIDTSQVDQWEMKNGNWSKSIDLGATKNADWTLAGVGDFNGDGTSDLLWRNIKTSQVDQWQMKNGNWSQSIDLGATKNADWIIAGIGDFNGDHTSDILWFNTATGREEYWAMQNGNWAGSRDLGALNASWKPSGIGDFNHDGMSDALWLDPASGHVFEQLYLL